MKKSLLFLALLGLVLTFSACGDDEPGINHDRDLVMEVKALTHAASNNGTQEPTITLTDVNKFTVHQKTLTMDFALKATIGGQEHSFNINGVPVQQTEGSYRFNFNQAHTTDAAVTNLKGMVDFSDPMGIFQYDWNGYHVCVTIPDVFFEQVRLNFKYSDGVTSQYNDSWFTLKVAAQKADFIIDQIEIAHDYMKSGDEYKRTGQYLKSITGKDVKMQPTAQGFNLSAEQIETIAITGTDIKTDYYPIYNLNTNVNLVNGTIASTFVLKHVLERSNNEQKTPTKWEDIAVTANGKIFRDKMFN